MPVLVVLSGLPGVGKSTVARALARQTGALWLRVDAMEQAMRESHMVSADLADGGYAALRAVAEGALQQGFDVIADAVTGEPVTRDPIMAVGAGAGARVLPVALICADRGVHRRRVESRAAEVPGLSLPSWEMVCARNWAPWPEALTLDTGVLSVADVVARIARRMTQDERKSP